MGSGTPGRAASTATTTRRPFSSAAEAIVARAPEADIWSGPRPFSSLVHSVHLDAESRGTYFLPILRPVTPCLQTSALLCGEPTSVPRIDCLKSAPWGVDQSCLGPLCLLREDWERSGGREAPGLLGHTGDPEVIRVCTMEFPAGRGSWESAMQPAGRCGFGGPAGLGSQVSPPASPCLPVGWEGQLSFPGLCSAWDWGPFMSGCRQGRTGYPELKPSGTPGLGHSSGI